MPATDWGILIAGLVPLLGAAAAWLRADAAKTSANAAHARINAMQNQQAPK